MNEYEAIILDTSKLKAVFWVIAENAQSTEFLDNLPDSIQDYDVIEEASDLERYTQKELVAIIQNSGQKEINRVRDKISGAKRAFSFMQEMKLKQFTGTEKLKEDLNHKKPGRKPSSESANNQAKQLIRSWYIAMRDAPMDKDVRKTRAEMVTSLISEFSLKPATAGQYIQHVRSEYPECVPESGSVRKLILSCMKVEIHKNTPRIDVLAKIKAEFSVSDNTVKNYYQYARQEYLNKT